MKLECRFIVMLLLFRQFRVKHYTCFGRARINIRTSCLNSLPQLLCRSPAVMKE